MKRKKLTIVGLVFSLIFLFGMIGNTILMTAPGYLTEENTTEFRATVKSVEMQGEGVREHGVVYSEEYGGEISTYSIRNALPLRRYPSNRDGGIGFIAPI